MSETESETPELTEDGGKTEAASDGSIVLPAKPGLQEAKSLLASLQDDPDKGDIVMDASAVETMSTPMTLLLVSAVRDRASADKSLAIVNASPAFTEAFSDLGFFQDMMKMEFRQ